MSEWQEPEIPAGLTATSKNLPPSVERKTAPSGRVVYYYRPNHKGPRTRIWRQMEVAARGRQILRLCDLPEADAFAVVSKLLRYDPATGDLHRIAGWRKGNQVTTAGNDGYLRVSIGDRYYQAHRVAWLLTYKQWPPAVIDHIDCDPTNNRLSNLRAATVGQNAANKRLSPSNTTGFKGVTRDGDKFVATVAGRYLGRFETAAAAGNAYASGAKEVFGEFARPASHSTTQEPA